MDRSTYIFDKLNNHFTKEKNTSYTSILFEDMTDIEAIEIEELDARLNRIIQGEPIQYVTGVAPFYGHFFNVDNRVLIPRPETEELVYTVEKYIRKQGLETASIIDIGTGSGCIPVSIHKLFPDADVFGLDVSRDAIAVAQSNNKKMATDVTLIAMDILNVSQWDELKEFQIIISNPPYIPFKETDLMSSNVLDHEPHLALFVEDEEPLLFYQKILQFAERQKGKTAVFLECNEFNAKEVAALFSLSFNTEIIQDLQGKDRIVKAISE